MFLPRPNWIYCGNNSFNKQGNICLFRSICDTNKVVVIKNHSSYSEAQIIVDSKDRRKNQAFYFHLNDDGYYTFFSIHSFKVLRVNNLYCGS